MVLSGHVVQRNEPELGRLVSTGSIFRKKIITGLQDRFSAPPPEFVVDVVVSVAVLLFVNLGPKVCANLTISLGLLQISSVGTKINESVWPPVSCWGGRWQ